jgi:hypothetical protein
MGDMARFDRWLSRGANVATFWPLLPSGLFGVLAAYLSRGVAAINAYGPFGWLMAGLVAFLLSAVAIYAAALAFDRFSAALARRKWARDVDSVNPLDVEFNRKRLKLEDLVHPASGRIVRKRFVECQLLGPANIIMMGQGFMNGTGFVNCDIVIHRDPVFIYNAIVLQDVEVIGGEIIKCTVYITQEMFDSTFGPMEGVNVVSYHRPWQGEEGDAEQPA